MKKIVDYKCGFEDQAGFSEEIIAKSQVSFPEAYKTAESMALLAKAVKEEKQAAFCMLPFCHTVEGESLGAIINYGNAQIGPRAGQHSCTTLEDLLKLPKIDFTKGRIAEVLKACQLLKEQGEKVVLEICGPFTILNTLMDIGKFFKIWRKNSVGVQAVFNHLQEVIYEYFQEAKKAGVDILCYADSTGGLNILGPRYMEEITETFTYPLLKRVENLSDENCIIQLCPKTSLALIGLEKAVWEEIKLPEAMSYDKACLYAWGQATFIGQTCIKNTAYLLSNKSIKSLKLI